MLCCTLWASSETLNCCFHCMEDILFSFDYKAYTLGFKIPVYLDKLKVKDRPLIYLKVQLEDKSIFFSEIAPLPSFGTESIDAALQFCENFSKRLVSLQTLAPSLSGLPCCQASLERALYLATASSTLQEATVSHFENTALLVAHNDTPKTVEGLLEQGFQNFKLKIGRLPFEEEQPILTQILRLMPKPGALRLDANGHLSLAQAQAYLDYLEGRGIAFLEQPLSPGNEDAMVALGKAYTTPIAWDESLVSLPSLVAANQKGFDGIYVIKPSLLGSLSGFLKWRKDNPEKRLVYSSAFESSLGLDSILSLAHTAPTALPLGLGTLAYLEPSHLVWHAFGPRVLYQPRLSQTKSAELFDRR